MFNFSRRWCSGLLSGAALGVLAIGAAGCSRERPPATSYDEIQAALDGVTTAAGVSALERMAACDLRIDWAGSSLLLIPLAAENIDMKPGDRILAVEFSAPNQPGESAGRTRAEARWRFRDGEVTPNNSWATTIQQARRPMGSELYLNC